MRIHLVVNQMLNGQSLQICEDYWHSFRSNQNGYVTLENHIKKICYDYGITFEELINKLMLIKADDTQVYCQSCGQMYELSNPCYLPKPQNLNNWQCEKCQNFMQRGVISLPSFVQNSSEFDDDCPF